MTNPLTTDHMAPHVIQMSMAERKWDAENKRYRSEYVLVWITVAECHNWRAAIIRMSELLRTVKPHDGVEYRIIQTSLVEN